MFTRNSFKGTNGAAFLVDIIMLASIVGIPVWILMQAFKKKK